MWSLRLVYTDGLQGESDEHVSFGDPMGSILEMPGARTMDNFSHLYKSNMVMFFS